VVSSAITLADPCDKEAKPALRLMSIAQANAVGLQAAAARAKASGMPRGRRRRIFSG
jgi:hypothetical protein